MHENNTAVIQLNKVVKTAGISGLVLFVDFFLAAEFYAKILWNGQKKSIYHPCIQIFIISLHTNKIWSIVIMEDEPPCI